MTRYRLVLALITVYACLRPRIAFHMRAFAAGPPRVRRSMQKERRSEAGLFKNEESQKKKTQNVSIPKELRERCICAWPQFLEVCANSKIPISVIVLCGAAAGNVGSALRSCALLGVTAVCVLGGLQLDAMKDALRVAQLDRKPHWNVVLVPGPEEGEMVEALGELQAAGLTLVGLTAAFAGSRPIWDFDLTLPKLALVFGRDAADDQAFPPGAAGRLDAAVTIPMSQRADGSDSLNLSNTVTAVAYERSRQLAIRTPPLR